MKKKVIFLTGTRADFGKIKSLLDVLKSDENFELFLFVTGMHLIDKYGYTINEIKNSGFNEYITEYPNHKKSEKLDIILSETIIGFSNFINKIQPDLIVIHGDRSEALAGAISGSFNNYLVCHIEGGELSGTIDELIRHSVSKLSHVHMVSNESAKNRLIQMGEIPETIHIIGSPDIDVMFSNNLPNLKNVRLKYEIDFKEYALVLFHPVTTEIDNFENYSFEFVESLIESSLNFVVIYPNNDPGSEYIITQYNTKLINNDRFRIFPSINFESFLTLLKNASFIIGNSSAGIREAPIFKIPTINIGSRQNMRSNSKSIINTNYKKNNIINAIKKIEFIEQDMYNSKEFGNANSSEIFYDILKSKSFWNISKQKIFLDN